MAISSEALGVQGIEMDYETLTLFSLDEFTDLSHGMTARSTKSKRKAEHPMNHWEDTNQTPLNAEKRSPFCTETIASPPSETLTYQNADLDTRIRWANELRRQAQTNY